MLVLKMWFTCLFSESPGDILVANPYQQQVIEEEDLSLHLGQFLFVRLVGIRHLKQTAAAHQTPVRHSKDLWKEVKEMELASCTEDRL